MLPNRAILTFVCDFFSPYLLKIARYTILGLVLFSFIGGIMLTTLSAQAAELSFQSEEIDPQLNQLYQERDQLEEEKRAIDQLEKLFNLVNVSNGCCTNFLVVDSVEESKAKLETTREDLNQAQVRLEQEIQRLEKRLRNYAIAEKVRSATNPSDYQNNIYDRFGYKASTISDCTWYAAEAVKLASGGQIDLNEHNSGFGNWGNAGEWATAAATFAQNNPNGSVSGVDKIPWPGDVMEWPGHVAFVEKVRDIRDEGGNLSRYDVTISEEMATGVGRIGSTFVKPDEDQMGLVKRWRTTLELEVTSNSEVAANVKFIHFDYK